MVPATSHQTPDDRVGSQGADADRQVCVLQDEAAQQALDVLDVELAVSVEERDEAVGGVGERGADARTQTGPVATVDFVLCHLDPVRVLLAEPFDDFDGVVLAAVVDHDDREVAPDAVEVVHDCGDDGHEVLGFVVRRHEEGDSLSPQAVDDGRVQRGG